MTEEERCSACFFSLTTSINAFTLCEVCRNSKLCTRCSIMDDLVLCPSCKSIEIQAANEFESKTQKLIPCITCHSVWNVSECGKCTHSYCGKCSTILAGHACFRCTSPGCITAYDYLCCDRHLCVTCYNRHIVTDCAQRLFYMCWKCKEKVLTFGPAQGKCPVVDCTFKYGCVTRKCNILAWFAPMGTYCQHHTSENNCPGCKLPYPLDSALGYGDVKIHILLGKRLRRREYCGTCLGKIAALVESSLIVLKRLGVIFPRVLMDKVVLFALDNL